MGSVSLPATVTSKLLAFMKVCEGKKEVPPGGFIDANGDEIQNVAENIPGQLPNTRVFKESDVKFLKAQDSFAMTIPEAKIVRIEPNAFQNPFTRENPRVLAFDIDFSNSKLGADDNKITITTTNGSRPATPEDVTFLESIMEAGSIVHNADEIRDKPKSPYQLR
jgi:hypothetical protein